MGDFALGVGRACVFELDCMWPIAGIAMASRARIARKPTMATRWRLRVQPAQRRFVARRVRSPCRRRRSSPSPSPSSAAAD